MILDSTQISTPLVSQVIIRHVLEKKESITKSYETLSGVEHRGQRETARYISASKDGADKSLCWESITLGWEAFLLGFNGLSAGNRLRRNQVLNSCISIY